MTNADKIKLAVIRKKLETIKAVTKPPIECKLAFYTHPSLGDKIVALPDNLSTSGHSKRMKTLGFYKYIPVPPTRHFYYYMLPIETVYPDKKVNESPQPDDAAYLINESMLQNVVLDELACMRTELLLDVLKKPTKDERIACLTAKMVENCFKYRHDKSSPEVTESRRQELLYITSLMGQLK